MKARQNYSVSSLNKRKGLISIQKQLLSKVLSSTETINTWKILVFDSYNRGIISSQLKMKDLRDHNITLYLNISEHREQIHGVTILYFVQPTVENIEIIGNDLISDLYTSVNIHFSSEPSANILSSLAKKVSAQKKNSLISRISKIEYSCTGFYCIDNSMCILPSQIQIGNLLSSLALKPIFVYNPNNEESVKFVDRLKTSLSSLADQMQQVDPQSITNYAIFYIFNRNVDLFPVLAHGITYAGLLENIYRVSKNGNKVSNSKDGKQGGAYTELSLQDEIWVNKKNYLISEMQLQKQFNKIKSKMMSLSSEEYTEYNEKCKQIQWHINNAEQMIKQAKKRRLNEFYEIQTEVYAKGQLSKDGFKDALALLRECNDKDDRARLIYIYLLYADNIDKLAELQAEFPDVKKLNEYNKIKESKLKGSMTESASNKYIKQFAKGIWKNLISSDKKFRVTKELEKIKSSDFSEIIEAGLAVESLGKLPSNARISRNIVYCLGGACFHEFSNIIESDPDVIYCGDRMVSYRDFI